ncbi:MAG: DNA internalization-related competence protein ComEC/Rec2 [Lachnospiraceae bacterium]|nr:DNA internalization-related competence protein ComEC/Rec2 [Lachnospiraceae bacterium]
MKKPSVVMALGLILGEIHRITDDKNILIMIILAFFFAGIFQYIKSQNKVLKTMTLLLVCYVIGFVLCDIQSDIFSKYDEKNIYREGLICEGYGKITSISEKDNYVEVAVSVGKSNKMLNYEKVLLRVYKSSKSNIPDSSYLGAVCYYQYAYKKLEEAANYGNFNSKSYYHSLGIAGVYNCENIKLVKKENQLYVAIDRVKKQAGAGIKKVMGDKYGSIMAAIVLGDRQSMDEETKNLYSDNGLSHILAVSGLHIATVGMILFQILRKFMSVKTSSVISGIVMILYGILTGGSVSCMRAVIMFIIQLGAGLTGRKYNPYVAISVSAIIILISNPYYLTNSSFIMSYVAIISVTLIIPMLNEYIKKKKKPWLNVISPILSGIILNIMMMPLICNYFYRLPVLAVITNMIVVPFMSVVLFSGLICGSCEVIADYIYNMPDVFKYLPGVISHGSGMVGKFFLWSFEKICLFISEIPGTIITTGKPRKLEIFIFYGIVVVMFLVLYNLRIKVRRGQAMKIAYAYMITGLAVLLTVSAYSIVSNHHMTGKELFVSFINVGQGDCIFIKDGGGNTYLYDCGSSSERKVAENTVVPHLRALGTDSINYIIVSHGDTDHVSGILEILQNDKLIKAENLVIASAQLQDEIIITLTNLAKQKDINVIAIESGDIIKSKSFILECIYPGKNTGKEDSNENSLVLKGAYKDKTILLTGDIGIETEEEIVSNYTEKICNISVLKVAHHGSGNSTGTNFLKITSPQMAVISYGKGNSYGHPHADTLSRLDAMGTEILTTEPYGVMMKFIGKKSVIWYNERSGMNR